MKRKLSNGISASSLEIVNGRQTIPQVWHFVKLLVKVKSTYAR
jgi:hypothetical protein